MDQHRCILESISYAFGRNMYSVVAEWSALKCQLDSNLFWVYLFYELLRQGIFKLPAPIMNLFISP